MKQHQWRYEVALRANFPLSVSLRLTPLPEGEAFGCSATEKLTPSAEDLGWRRKFASQMMCNKLHDVDFVQ